MKPWKWALGASIVAVKVIAEVGVLAVCLVAIWLALGLVIGDTEMEKAVGAGIAAVILLLMDIRGKMNKK